MMIAFLYGGLPYLKGIAPSSIETGKSQVHVVSGIYESDIKPVIIGKYASINMQELSEDEREFANSVMGERGVFQKNDMVLLSLGEEALHQKVSFIRQDVRSNEVRIYVKVEADNDSTHKNESSYLLGRISIPATMPISFIDGETGNLLY